MAMKKEVAKVAKKVINQKHKIIVEEGRAFIAPLTDHKVLHTEYQSNIDLTKKRVAELKEEFPNKDVVYFSV